jgi:hypothetical protein
MILKNAPNRVDDFEIMRNLRTNRFDGFLSHNDSLNLAAGFNPRNG